MYAGGLTLDDAHDYLKHCRPLISPNLNFMRQLAEFETGLSTAGDRSGNKVVDIRRPSDELVASVVGHCSSRLNAPSFRQIAADGGAANPSSGAGLPAAVETTRAAAGKKRKVLSDLLLPCGPTAPAPKVSKMGLQPPPTPCVKQTFLFDFATVAVLMSSHGTVASPTVSHSPLVSPS